MKQFSIKPRLVEFIPTHLEDGVLYVSEKYQTAIHKCCCGCGQEVVTPLSSAQWQVRIVGEKVTLYPSIGNWNSKCKSHYWIKKNRIVWADSMTESQIRQVKKRDHHDLQKLINDSNLKKIGEPEKDQLKNLSAQMLRLSIWRRIWNWIINK